MFSGELDEDEYLVFSDIIRALNEGRKFQKVNNAYQYEKVVKEIFAAVDNKPDKRLKRKLIDLDDAFQDNNWKEVNALLNVISNMV